MADKPIEPVERPFGIYLAIFLLGVFVATSIVSSGYWYKFHDPGPGLGGIENIYGSCVLFNGVVALCLMPLIFKGSIGASVFGIFYSIYILMSLIMFPELLGRKWIWLLIAVGLIGIFVVSLAVPSSLKFSEKGKEKRVYRTHPDS